MANVKWSDPDFYSKVIDEAQTCFSEDDVDIQADAANEEDFSEADDGVWVKAWVWVPVDNGYEEIEE